MKITFEKWIPLTRSKSDDELKTLAKELFNNAIFTDRHIRDSSDLRRIFMVLMFMGHRSYDATTRQGKIERLLTEAAKDNYFLTLGKTEDEARKDYFSSIGLIYEYYDKAMPMGINGYPIFGSCRFLSKEDTEKMFEFYDKYCDMQKKLSEEFGG